MQITIIKPYVGKTAGFIKSNTGKLTAGMALVTAGVLTACAGTASPYGKEYREESRFYANNDPSLIDCTGQNTKIQNDTTVACKDGSKRNYYLDNGVVEFTQKGKVSETFPLEDIYYIFHPKNSK